MNPTVSISSPTPGPAWPVLAAVCLASAAMPLTFTGPAVAVRDIAASLGEQPTLLAWVTNAFMLGFGGCLMVAGALADRQGRRKVFLAGLVAFMLASAALVVAPGLLVFDLLRLLQGVASAAVLASGGAALAQAFDGPARLRAFSLLGTSFGAGLTLGPVAAGWLTDRFGWRAIFLLVIACAAVAFVLAVATLRESRDPGAQSLDRAGAATFTGALAAFTVGLLQAPQAGWGSVQTLATLAASALLLAWFVRIEKRAARPMLDLDLFHYPRFVGVQLLAAAPAYGFVVLLVLLPVRFIGIEGLPVGQAGRWMAMLSAPLLVLPLVAGQLARRIAPATICGAGLLLSAAGLVWLGLAGSGQGVLAPMLLIGVGMGLPWGLMDGLAVSVVPKERAGMANGIFSTTRVAGEGLALAVVAAALVALISHRLGLPADAARAVAQRLASGDLPGASALWPALSPGVLAGVYQSAFSTLALMLAAITALTALVVFLFLGRPAKALSSPACPLPPVCAE